MELEIETKAHVQSGQHVYGNLGAPLQIGHPGWFQEKLWWGVLCIGSLVEYSYVTRLPQFFHLSCVSRPRRTKI